MGYRSGALESRLNVDAQANAKIVTPRSKRWLRVVLGLTVSIACIGIMIWQVDVRGMIKAISGFAWIYLLLGLMSLTLDYVIRIVRWRMMLRAAVAEVSV